MKIYECPKCFEISTNKKWDQNTMKKLNIEGYWDNYGRIDDEKDLGCIYVCPVCGQEINGNEILEVY